MVKDVNVGLHIGPVLKGVNVGLQIGPVVKGVNVGLQVGSVVKGVNVGLQIGPVLNTIQYNFIAKCHYTDCKRNVLWCQVHSSHIHSNHKTFNCNNSK